MRKDTIKNYIDKKIVTNLSTMGYSETRQDLFDIILRFTSSISENPKEQTEEAIEQLSDARNRYLNLYIFYAKKRIIDIYKIEARDWYGWSGSKKFKAILLKEKLSKCN